jgi:hypothetical protein
MPHGSRLVVRRTYQILTAAAARSEEDPGRVVLGRRGLPLPPPTATGSTAAAIALHRDGGDRLRRVAGAPGEVRRAPVLCGDRRGRLHEVRARGVRREGSRVSEARAWDRRPDRVERERERARSGTVQHTCGGGALREEWN